MAFYVCMYVCCLLCQIYRFKENLLWTVDENGYYTNSSARYLTYNNPNDLGPNTTRFELEALKSALAVALATHRILILPSFHCCSGCAANSRGSCSNPRFRCSLLSILRISTFDQTFGGRYREHSFLANGLVPEGIKRGVSDRPLFINTSAVPQVRHSLDADAVELLSVGNYSHGATLSEVVRWVSERSTVPVIRFHSLYGNSVDWESDAKFGSKLRGWFGDGFECSEYQQWDRSMLNLANMWPGRNSTRRSI